jgi:hypothetical protein
MRGVTGNGVELQRSVNSVIDWSGTFSFGGECNSDHAYQDGVETA